MQDIWIPADTNMFNLTWQFTHTISPNAFEVQRKINSEVWETITDDYQDTTLLIILDNLEDDYYFRVRAMVNGEWYPSSWSNTVQVQLITGTEKFEFQAKTILYPNPAGDFCIIESQSKNELVVALRITDVYGKTLFQLEQKQPAARTLIDIKSWDRGVYLAEIKTLNTRKIIKFIKN
jgi:hypothetical protein